MGVDLGPSSQFAPARPAVSAPRAAREAPARQVRDDGEAHGTGTVNAVDPAQRRINLSHDPIPSIGWPAMTMEFPVAPGVDISRVRPGGRANFDIGKGAGGMYEIRSLQPGGAPR
jgi:Cu/Ag efflux protein CusF